MQWGAGRSRERTLRSSACGHECAVVVAHQSVPSGDVHWAVGPQQAHHVESLLWQHGVKTLEVLSPQKFLHLVP